MNTTLKLSSLLAGAVLLTSSLLTTQASAATTHPVGYVTLSITPGSGAEKSTNILSVPLLPPQENLTGASVGTIASVTPNSIIVADAGWSNGELSNSSSPYLVKVTSGTAEGLTLPVSTTIPNTSNELFIANNFSSETLDLTSLGINLSTDTFEIIPADTLLSLFGSPESTNVDGGSSASDADTIILFNNGWNVYFYSTTKNAWVRSTFGFPIANDTIIHPDYALIYERLPASPLSFVITGEVPTNARNAILKDTGITFLANGWPVNTTLNNSGLQNTSGWVSGASATVSDQVIIRSATGWNVFFHNGTNWVKSTFGFPNANNEPLPLGQGVIINRIGSGGGLKQLSQSLPYIL